MVRDELSNLGQRCDMNISMKMAINLILTYCCLCCRELLQSSAVKRRFHGESVHVTESDRMKWLYMINRAAIKYIINHISYLLLTPTLNLVSAVTENP